MDNAYLILAMVTAVALLIGFMTWMENWFLRRRLDMMIQRKTMLGNGGMGTVFYPLGVIARYRLEISKSFPAQFVSQFEPHQFEQLVEERLRTALDHAEPEIGPDGRPRFME